MTESEERITSAVVRRLRDMKSRCAAILHSRIDEAVKLIEDQAKEIERLRKEQAK